MDAGRLESRDDQLHVGGSLGESTTLAKEGHAPDSSATRLLECREDVARLAAGAQHDEDIARLRKCGDLPGKNFGEFVVVANGRQQAGIHGEGHRGIGTPVFPEAAGELRGQVGAVTGASSVAAEEELVTGQKCVAGQRGRLF